MKISVIVPIYNSEKYLRNTIDSILNQTLDDFELILINDGSTDSSLSICKEYKKQDSRIVLINQKNCGVSITRNNGLKIAKGEYISFIDSDDWIRPNFLEKLYNAAIDNGNNADIVLCNRLISNGKTSWFLPFEEKQEFRKKNLKEYLHNVLLGNYESFVTNKLYKNDLIKKYNVRFIDSSFMEDNIFNLEIIDKSNLIIFIPDPLYIYRNVFNGLTNKIDKKRCESLLLNYQKKKIINEKYLSLKELEEFECYFMKVIVSIVFYDISITKKFDYQSFIQKYNLSENFKRCRNCNNQCYSWCNDIKNYYNGKKVQIMKKIILKKTSVIIRNFYQKLFYICFFYKRKE